MMPDSNNDFSSTTSPTNVRLEPEVIDLLPSTAEVPEELSKFCFPNDIYLSIEPLPPKTFDIVLTGSFACVVAHTDLTIKPSCW